MPYVSRDIDLYYADRDDADPDAAGRAGSETVLFCHGAGGNGTSWWQQMDAFPGRFRCLALDHRGFGRSRCRPEQFSVTEYGADAVAVLDAAGVASAHVVCQSMGGWTGVQLALGHPDRVASLVLSDTIGGFALPAGIDSVRGMGERAAGAGAVSPALAADFHLRDPARAFLYLELSAFNEDPERLDLFRRLFAPEVMTPLQRAAELTMPVMIVAGTHDLIWPPEVLEELAGHIPGARFEQVDAGHSPYFENPAAFNRVLMDFLTKH